MRTSERARIRALAEIGSPSAPKDFVGSPSAAARENTLFRRVLYTGPEVQFVVMSLLPAEDIGLETHARVEQMITVASGEAEALLDGVAYTLRAGDAVVVPPGVKHNVRNTGEQPLKLYTVYAPPNHLAATRHATKAAAERDTADARFSRKVNKGT